METLLVGLLSVVVVLVALYVYHRHQMAEDGEDVDVHPSLREYSHVFTVTDEDDEDDV